MHDKTEVTIRKAEVKDIENLKTFFINAYGMQTIFQNEEFLLYFFKGHTKNSAPLGYSLIAIGPDGEIVSHYGGLFYRLQLNKAIVSLIWGVNAYTLPAWRGKGINSKIVDYIHNNNEANGVIGMPFDAPFFYKKLGYNIFDKETLARFVYVLDKKVFNIISVLGNDTVKAAALLTVKTENTEYVSNEKIVALSKDNFKAFDIDLHSSLDDALIATTYRDAVFLHWRLFGNPYLSYNVFGYLEMGRIVTYVAVREEILEPGSFKIKRIVDLFGKKEGIIPLLNQIINEALSDGSVYIDFSMYGRLYEKELFFSGFNKLEKEDVCILPMVTAPMENRPNHEFIVLQSKVHDSDIQKLSYENVYFTRIDGDRDRIARLTQLKSF